MLIDDDHLFKDTIAAANVKAERMRPASEASGSEDPSQSLWVTVQVHRQPSTYCTDGIRPPRTYVTFPSLSSITMAFFLLAFLKMR